MGKKLVLIMCCIFTFIFAMVNVGYQIVFADEVNNSNNYKFKSKILIESTSGKVLEEVNADEQLPIASIVKLMTLYITFDALENGSLNEDDLINVSEYASSMGGSQLFLDANTKHKVCDLIKSIVIASANDSAVVLAESIAGNEGSFVDRMNKTAQDLGLKNTHYVDCTGLDDFGYSSARDVAKLSKLVLSNPHYLKYSQIWLDSYTHPSGRETQLANTNKLIKNYNYCVAGKTGTTENAGYCYTSLCEKKGFNLIAVVLGADSTSERFEIVKETVQTGYANYKFTLKYHTGDLFKEISLPKAKQNAINVYISNDLGVVEEKNSLNEFAVDYNIFNVNLPLKANSIIGELFILDKDGNIVAKSDLIIKENIEKMQYMDNIKYIMRKW